MSLNDVSEIQAGFVVVHDPLSILYSHVVITVFCCTADKTIDDGVLTPSSVSDIDCVVAGKRD